MEASNMSNGRVVDFDTGTVVEPTLEATHNAEVPALVTGLNADTTSSSVHNSSPEPDRSNSENLSADEGGFIKVNKRKEL